MAIRRVFEGTSLLASQLESLFAEESFPAGICLISLPSPPECILLMYCLKIDLRGLFLGLLIFNHST